MYVAIRTMRYGETWLPTQAGQRSGFALPSYAGQAPSSLWQATPDTQLQNPREDHSGRKTTTQGSRRTIQAGKRQVGLDGN